MTNGDEKQYLAICRAIFRQLPKIKTEWELCWNDDSAENFANIDLQLVWVRKPLLMDTSIICLMTKEQLILSALSAFGFFICLSTMPTIASKLLP